MVCARVRVAWLHGLPIALALALPHVAGSASFNAVAFLVIYIYIYIIYKYIPFCLQKNGGVKQCAFFHIGF